MTDPVHAQPRERLMLFTAISRVLDIRNDPVMSDLTWSSLFLYELTHYLTAFWIRPFELW